MNHSIFIPGPSRSSNQPLPCRESACATKAWACVMFGKCPTRTFVSPNVEHAVATANKIDNEALEICIPRLSILKRSAQEAIAPNASVPPIVKAARPGFRCLDYTDSDNQRAASPLRRDRNCLAPMRVENAKSHRRSEARVQHAPWNRDRRDLSK